MSAWNPDVIPKSCAACDERWIEEQWQRHLIDLLAARDPEQKTWLADFEAWVEQFLD